MVWVSKELVDAGVMYDLGIPYRLTQRMEKTMPWVMTQKGMLLNLDRVEVVWAHPSNKGGQDNGQVNAQGGEHCTRIFDGPLVQCVAIVNMIRDALTDQYGQTLLLADLTKPGYLSANLETLARARNLGSGVAEPEDPSDDIR
jgi:hypothetical protein